ncbi:MAG TPA: hypothetical protein PKY12_02330 [Catalimonadaceae bacterium]|nr:hypothetical protein [Catalimonadaceae bacterium]
MITNQYLWLTHHSGLSNFDKGDELTDLYINEVIPDKGVYAMIDDMRTPTLNTTTSGIINGLRSIHKSGGVEFELKDFPLRPFNVFYGGLGKDCPTFGTPISSPFSFYNRRSLPKMKTPYQANANSFASNELVFPFIFDGGPDNSYRGTNHAFGNSGEIEELSINSGNPIFGHLTFNTANQDFSPMVFNGLAVYVYPRVANTDMKVGIRYDRNTFLVNQRLVGHFSLRPIPIFDGSSTPDLVIGENITISLDKMLNPNRTNKGSNNLYPDFITPSRFICKAGSVLELEEEATFIIENESGLVFESNSKIILAENSKIIIRSGCTFHAFDGCTLEVATGARIILEDNSFYCINPNLIYEGDNSSDIFRLGLNLGSTSPKLQPPYLVTPSSCSSVENFPLTFNCNSISIGGPASSFNLQKVGGAESSVSSPLSTSGLTDGQYHIISTNSTGLPGSYQSSFYIYGQSGAANFSSDHSFSNLVILNNNLSVSGGNIIIEPQTQVFVTGTPVNPTCAEPGFCPGYITGGDITLSGSARLDVRDGATFQGMCGNMWGGIAISDFAGLSAYNNMIFRDSYDGIETLGNEDNSDLIQLHVFNARFENNYKAIKQNDALDAFNFVRNSSFTSSHLTMKAPFNYSSGSPCLKFVSQRHLAYDHCMVNYGNLWNNSFANAQTGLEVGNASRGFNSVKNQFTNHYGKAIHLKSGSGVQLNFDQDVITLPNDLFFCEGDGETIPNFITPGSPYAKYGFFVEGLDNIPVIKSAVISGPTSFSSTGLFRNVGIYAHGGSFTTLTRCTLQNLNYGMVFYGSTASGTRTNSITENQFANNEQNLRFRNTYKSNFKLNLKCNTFTTPASPAPFTTRYGIWVEAGAEMPDIGGDLSPATPEKPAGNWWPVAGTTDPGIPPNWPITLNSGIDMEGWYSPIGWETVHNLTEDEWSYFQYKNEYLGPYFNPNGNPYFLPNIVDRVVRSRSDQVNSTAFVMDDACSNFGQILVFPTRPAISQDSTLTANVIAMQSGDQFLGQNIPNPSTSTTAIFYKFPDKSKRGRLEFFELGTGRIVKSIGIQVAGQGKIEFGLQGFANGIYGYRLFAEDKPVAWKKMIVAR